MSYTEVFKNAQKYGDPQTSIFVRKDEDGCVDYISAQDINDAFKDTKSPGNFALLQDLMDMMLFLQRCSHGGNYSDVKYANAPEEYPQRYEMLVQGLTDETIQAMRSFSPPLAGVTFRTEKFEFLARLTNDRQAKGLKTPGDETSPEKPVAARLREHGVTFTLQAV